MTPFDPHAARSRWFGGPPLADVTPRERALRRVGWRHGGRFHVGSGPCLGVNCQPVYVVREAR